MSQVEHLPTDQSSLESLRSEMFASFKYRLCTAVSHAFIGVHHEEYFRSETFKSWRNSFMNSRYGGTLSLGRMTDFALDGYGFFVNKFFPALLTLDFGRFCLAIVFVAWSQPTQESRINNIIAVLLIGFIFSSKYDCYFWTSPRFSRAPFASAASTWLAT